MADFMSPNSILILPGLKQTLLLLTSLPVNPPIFQGQLVCAAFTKVNPKVPFPLRHSVHTFEAAFNVSC